MTQKKNGLVLENFYEKDLEELGKDYQELIDKYQKEKYGVELKTSEVQFIAVEVLENSSWKGTEVYGIKALRDIVTTLEGDKIVLCDRENVRALFHYLNQYESKGTAFADVQMAVLEKVSLVIKEINEVENDVRDASFEMEAKRQGIDPEELRTAQDAAASPEGAALAAADQDAPDLG